MTILMLAERREPQTSSVTAGIADRLPARPAVSGVGHLAARQFLVERLQDVTDASIGTAGSVGVRGVGAATWDAFHSEGLLS